MKPPERFGSRLGMMLTMLGMAVGTGNIWRFPRIAVQNGGGEFLIAWFVFLFLRFGRGRDQTFTKYKIVIFIFYSNSGTVFSLLKSF